MNRVRGGSRGTLPRRRAGARVAAAIVGAILVAPAAASAEISFTEGTNVATTPKFEWDFGNDPSVAGGTGNIERVDSLRWRNSAGTLGANLAANGNGSGCGSPSEFWGQSYADADGLPPGPVVAGTVGTWVPRGDRTIQMDSEVTSPACSGSSVPIPVRTRYSFFDEDDAGGNMVRVERRWDFPANAPAFSSTHGLRAYVPRLSAGTYGGVIYPKADESGLVTSGPVYSTDWNGKWVALNAPSTNAGLLILRDPANASPANVVTDFDGASSSNLSGVTLLRPAPNGWTSPLTETEFLCFYDATTWPVASRSATSLPEGCEARSVPINTSAPTISGPAGNPNPGSQLSASPGGWDHAVGGFEYRWSRCVGTSCEEIAGASGANYTATGADVGKSLKVAVTATSADGERDTAESTLAGSIAGRVLESGAPPTPLPGARVQACRVLAGGAPGGCRMTTSDSNGDYHLQVPQSGDYEVRAFPPASSSALSKTTQVTVVDEIEATAPDLVLSAPAPPPPNVNVTGPGFRGTAPGGVPVVHWDVPFSIRIYVSNGPPGTQVDAKLETPGGDLDPIDEDFEEDEDSPDDDDGWWEFDFPSTNPLHGNGFVRITITPPTPEDPDGDVDFPIYIDPSGFVRTTDGAALPGATVVLYRSDFPDGPFSVVPDGSDVMSPSNRKNPDTSDSTGHFGWDVVAGYYKVRASKAGCHAPGNAAQAFVDTHVMEIPPPVTNLDIRLACPGPAVPGPSDPGSSDPGPSDPAPPDPVPLLDTTTPDTEITKGPKKKSKKGKATFAFTASERSAGFQCSLDGGAFKPCRSPFQVKVKKGKHTFEVRAVDTAGNTDPTPAKTTWTVRKKKRK